METLADKIEAACRAHHHAPLGLMVRALIDNYWQAKTERADVTRALYRSVVELDNAALIEAFAARVDAAIAVMLASAPDATFADLGTVNLTLVTVIFGTVRNIFERNLIGSAVEALRWQLVTMYCSYVGAATA